jgi:hypothetical protein
MTVACSCCAVALRSGIITGMSGPEPTPLDGPARGAELYKAGPWLVVYGAGLETEDAARAIRQRCLDAGITTDVRPIDETGPRVLARYFGLVLVLPYPPLDVRMVTRRYDEVLLAYRASHPYGLHALLSGRRSWHEVGVVQLVGPEVVMRHPRANKLRRIACFSHMTADKDDEVDPLAVYSGGSVHLVAADPDIEGQDARLFETQWRVVKSWGVTNQEEVGGLRDCLEKLRAYYENPRRPALYRPLGANIRQNALDLILDGDWTSHQSLRSKSNTENLARVWRKAYAEMKRLVPELTRPPSPNAVRDLHKLYLALRILHDIEGFQE